jgi:Uma2 family endonuclease
MKFMQSSILEFSEGKLTKISVKDYEFLCRENPMQYEKTELFEGVIVEKMTKSSKHIFFKHYLVHALQENLPKSFFIQTEDSIRLGDSELEPDISVIYGSFMDYQNTLPETARLIVEISISSLNYDREKAKAYANGNVEEYWILDVENKKVEVFTQPQNGNYLDRKIFTFQEEILAFGKSVSLKDV